MTKSYTVTILLAAVLVAVVCGFLLPNKAWPQTIVDTQCTNTGCTTIIGRSQGGLGKVISVPQKAYDPERDERIAKWTAFCEPKIVQGPPYWVRKYVYKHPGCEYGRDE